ncbi:DUF1186 domain-containing protein [Methylocystis hirsuta]|nr:DUF1186 domain-containing protein [Methylocystis hirsuta]
MDASAILEKFTSYEDLPSEALRAASARRAEMTPFFLEEIEKYLAASSEERDGPTPLFFIFFLLGEWREKSAYRSLARLLRISSDDIHALLDDGVTEASHRVMAAVFDGDPEPLFDIILDSQADEYIRSRMCEVLAMLVVAGELSKDRVASFLAEAFGRLPKDEEECFVWNGWMDAIAALGLTEMRPLVAQAFERGWISPSWTDIQHFDRDLAHAAANPDRPFYSDAGDMTLWGDTVEELSTWYGFSERYKEDRERARIRSELGPFGENFPEPYVNPSRDVGRNDPCPCGSGKKYKKCCLT